MDSGHRVDAAEDAVEADYYLNEHLPDIAIVDLGLPDEDGLSHHAAGAAVMFHCRFWC